MSRTPSPPPPPLPLKEPPLKWSFIAIEVSQQQGDLIVILHFRIFGKQLVYLLVYIRQLTPRPRPPETAVSDHNMGSTCRGDLKELLTSAIGALKRVRQFVPPPTLQTMYNSFIQLYFDYCSVVWEGLGSELALTLQEVQNGA